MNKNDEGYLVGDYVSNEGYGFDIMGKNDDGSWTIRFNDDYRHTRTARKEAIVNGQVKNPYHPSAYGIGYMGAGDYVGSKVVDGVQTRTREYETWRGIMKRCYCSKTQERQPSYIGCSVHSDWYNFQTFARWYTEQPGYVEGWDVDKDLLIEGNMVYGPNTCVLLPRPINSLLGLVDFVGERFLPRGIHMKGGYYRIEIGGLSNKRVTRTFKSKTKAIELRNQNTTERIAEIVDVYGDKLPKHVISIIKKRLHKLLWIPVEESNS